MRIRWRHIKRTAGWLAGLVVAVVIVPPLGQFFVVLADKRGWYSDPLVTVRAVIAGIAFVAGNPWFHWIGGGVIGFAIGAWLDALFRSREESSEVAPSPPLVWLLADAAVAKFAAPELLEKDREARVLLCAMEREQGRAYQALGKKKLSPSPGVREEGEITPLEAQRKVAADNHHRAINASAGARQDLLRHMRNQMLRGTLVARGYRSTAGQSETSPTLITPAQWQTLEFNHLNFARIQGGEVSYRDVEIAKAR